jgi:curved DNA-binding protein
VATRDYYGVLGVPPEASAEEIRTAFRRLARRHHPDARPGDAAAAERFKEISEAYDVLSDPEKRRAYDAERQAEQQAERQGIRFEHVVEGDPFADLFSFFGRDRAVRVPVTLEEALRGASRVVTLGGRRVEVRLPPGADTGDRFALPGGGEVEVEVQPHPRFSREGDDLRCRLGVPVWTLLLGGDVPVATLSDRVTLHVPAETGDGDVLRLRGQGMPRRGGPGRGDLYVEVHAELPRGLREEERVLIRRLAALRAGRPGQQARPA